MKRIVFSKYNDKFKAYEVLGSKDYNYDIENVYLHEYGDEMKKELSEIINVDVKYHIEKLNKDGSFSILAELSK